MKYVSRREMLRLIAGASALITTPLTLTGCGEDDGSAANNGPLASNRTTSNGSLTQIIRKSASEMTTDEIAAFKKAFDLFVTTGPSLEFNIQHFDFDRHQHHGAIIPPDSLSAEIHEGTPADRFLPWHRAFIIEFEKVCITLLRDTGDDAAADLFFVPYWDGATDQAMPPWMNDYVPTGSVARSVDGLPPGHVAENVPDGTEYNVRLERWVGLLEGFETLPPQEQIDHLMAIEDYETFTRTSDYSLTILTSGDPTLATEMETTMATLPGGGTMFQPLADAVRSGSVAPSDQVTLLRALIMLKVMKGRLRRAADAAADAMASLLAMVTPVLLNAPHGTYHLWSAGEDPDNLGPDPGSGLRGTATYFNELVGDPMFWMLHCDLDRLWYAWQERHGLFPPLTGDATRFETWDDGATWELDDLVNHSTLPYKFNKLQG